MFTDCYNTSLYSYTAVLKVLPGDLVLCLAFFFLKCKFNVRPDLELPQDHLDINLNLSLLDKYSRLQEKGKAKPNISPTLPCSPHIMWLEDWNGRADLLLFFKGMGHSFPHFTEYFAILFLLNTILKRHTEILLNFIFQYWGFFFFPFNYLACDYVFMLNCMGSPSILWHLHFKLFMSESRAIFSLGII